METQGAVNAATNANPAAPTNSVAEVNASPESNATPNANATSNATSSANEPPTASAVSNTDDEPCSSSTIPQAQNGQLPPGYSKTDSVIEDILRKAASEFAEEEASSSSAPVPAPKPKRGRKKNNNAAAAAAASSAAQASSSVSAPVHIAVPLPANVVIDQSAKINASVESVMQKVHNNVPFDEDFNPMIPAPNQQIVWPTAPPPGPQQTFYMVQDDQIYPMVPPPIQQQVPLPMTQQIPPPPQQVTQTPVPATAKPAKKPRVTKKMKEAAAAAAAAQAQSQANGFSSPLPAQSAIPVTAYNPNPNGTVYRGTPSSGPQHVVLMQPGQSQPRQPTYQQVPVSYTPAPGSNGVPQYVYSNINEYLRHQPGSSIVSPNGQVTKVVAYQPGMPIPPGATFVTQPGQSPAPAYTQVAHHSPQQQPQYIIQQQPPAPTHVPIPTPVAAPTAAPVPTSTTTKAKRPAAAAAASEDAPGPSSGAAPKRRRKAVKKDNALSNFDDSDFEDLGPSVKTLTKAAKAAKKDKEPKAPKKPKKADKPEPPKKETAKKEQKEPTVKKSATKDKKAKKGTTEVKKADENSVRLKELASKRNAGGKDPATLIEEITILQKVYSHERTRVYNAKRRCEKLEEDYHRVFDRLQQTELSLAVHMSSCEKLKRDVRTLQDENRELRIARGEDVPPRLPTPEPCTSRSLRASRRLGLPVVPPSDLPPKARESSPAARPASPTPETPKKEKASSAAASTPAPATTTSKAAKTRSKAAATAASPPVTRRKRGRARSQSPVEEASPDSGVDAPVAESETDQQSKSYTANDFLPRRAAASKRIRYF